MNKNENSYDPIMAINMNKIKKDILYLKEEALKDFKENSKIIFDKYSASEKNILEQLNHQENRLNSLEVKIIEISKLKKSNESLEEKMKILIDFEKKADDLFLKEKAKFDNLTKILNKNIERIDQILSSSVIYPNIIGKNKKYKTFHDLIDYILSELSLNLLFREKNIIDLKNYKIKIENTFKKINEQNNIFLKTAEEFTINYLKEHENKIKSMILLLEEKISHNRIRNIEDIINLKKCLKEFKKEINFIKLIYKINNNEDIRFLYEKNKLETKKNKRYSKNKIKDYIIGKINFSDLLEKKRKTFEYTNFFHQEKKIDSYKSKNKKRNSCLNFFNYEKQIYSNKKMILQNIKNNKENNKIYINDSNSKSIIANDIKDINQNIKKNSVNNQITIKENSHTNNSINLKNFELEKIKQLIKIKYKKKLSFPRIKSAFFLKDKAKNSYNKKDIYNYFKPNFNKIPMHYATVFQYNGKLNNTKTKNNQNKRISEIKPADNFILMTLKKKQ